MLPKCCFTHVCKDARDLLLPRKQINKQMVRVSWVCGVRVAVVLATIVLLGITYVQRLSGVYEKDPYKFNHAYSSSHLSQDVAGELHDERRQSPSKHSEASVATAAVHQRRRPPPAYSARDMPFDERMKVRRIGFHTARTIATYLRHTHTDTHSSRKGR